MDDSASRSKIAVRDIKRIYQLDGIQVSHIALDPGEEIPWHHHSEVSDTFFAARGPVTIETRNPTRSLQLETGQTFQAVVGQPHRVSNQTGSTIEFLLIQGVGRYDFIAER